MAGNLLLLTFLISFGPGEVGTTALPLLKVAVGPRASAMGETYVGLVPDVSALFWNPAGLGHFSAAQLGLSHHEWFLDTRDENLATCLPLGPGSLGAGLVYSGIEDLETWDPENNRGDSVSLRSGYALIGYGVTVARRFSLGLTVKGLYDRLSRTTGLGVAADLGALYQLTHRLRVGFSGRNLGSEMRYGSQEYPLPTSIRVGASYSAPRFCLLLDADAPIDNYPSLHFGGEYELNRLFALRGGVRLGPQDWQSLSWTSFFTAGAGVNIDRLHLDYALVPYGPLGLTHRLGIRFDFEPRQFGRVRIRTREFASGRPLRARFELSGVQQGESQTDEDGNFVLSGVETGWLRIKASAEEHSPAADSVFVEPRGTHDVSLALRKAGFGSLWGAVYEANTRRILRARVSYQGPVAGSIETSDTTGTFTLRRLPAGDYEFSVCALDGCHKTESATITIEPFCLSSYSFFLERGPAPTASDSAAAGQGTMVPDSSAVAPIDTLE
ncbi:MAG: PorV/PorQ family protein [candidate division WOR-3 bacterium]